MNLRTILSLLTLFWTPACVGTTGGQIIDFDAAASGPKDANGELTFDIEITNGTRWTVDLTKATLHVGAMYLDDSLPVSGAQNTACILPGTYVAEVTTGLDVDLLSSGLQHFPSRGHGTTLSVQAAQVWLTHGDVDTIADPDPYPILDIEGTASLGSDVRPFVGTITISSNRANTAGNFPGAYPICKQRIVSPIPTTVGVQAAGGLLLTIDPRQLFNNVDFGQLANVSGSYVFSDDPSDSNPSSLTFYSQPSANLYSNLVSAGSTNGPNLYSFEWDPNL